MFNALVSCKHHNRESSHMQLIQMIRRGVQVALIGLATATGAAAQPEAGDAATAQVLQTLKETYRGTRFTSVRPSDVAGIYEVVMGTRVAYTDATGRYFLFGRLVDMQTQEDLTAQRTSELQRVELSSLPLEHAVKTVRGKGERVLYVFEDPECGYCKALHKTLATMDNLTVYTWLVPILGPRSVASAERIWCAADRSAALIEHMSGKTPRGGTSGCETPLKQNVALSEQLGVKGTPTMFTATGKRLVGAMSAEQLAAAMSERPNTVARGN